MWQRSTGLYELRDEEITVDCGDDLNMSATGVLEGFRVYGFGFRV